MKGFESQPPAEVPSQEQLPSSGNTMLAENMFQAYYEKMNKVESLSDALLASGASLRVWLDSESGKKAIEKYAKTHTDEETAEFRDMGALVEKYRADSEPIFH